MGDDSEQMKARLRELERENSMLKAAINSSPAGIVIASAPDGVIEFINPAALGIRGAPEDELREIPIELHPSRWQLFRSDGTPFAAEDLPLSRAVLNGEETSQGVEMFMEHRGGDRRWIEVHAAPVKDDQGNVVAGVAVFPDITKRKQVEDELLRFQSMAHASPDFVGIAAADARIIYINPAGWRMCGYPADYAPGDYRIDKLHSPAVARLIREEAIPTARREGSWFGESDLLTRDGEVIPVSQAVMFHTDPAGKQDYVSTVMRDLRPIRALEADLNQSRRLDSMGRLAGGVATRLQQSAHGDSELHPSGARRVSGVGSRSCRLGPSPCRGQAGCRPMYTAVVVRSAAIDSAHCGEGRRGRSPAQPSVFSKFGRACGAVHRSAFGSVEPQNGPSPARPDPHQLGG